MSADESPLPESLPDESAVANTVTDKPLSPSVIAQFVRHDRCPRYLKQKWADDPAPDGREWREAFQLVNVAQLGYGQEFEARQLEVLATNATKIIGPRGEDSTQASVPDIKYDETWAASSEERIDQLQTAAEDAASLSTDTDTPPYILCYQAPLGGQVGNFDLWGEVDCLVFAPKSATETVDELDLSTPATTVDSPHGSSPESSATAPASRHPQATDSDATIVARVLEIKSAKKRKPAHHVQGVIYSSLLEQTLSTDVTPTCRIEASILTQPMAELSDDPYHPLAVPTFQLPEWECYTEPLLATGGPVETVLQGDLDDLPFAIDRVCNNCEFQEACATYAVENPTTPASLALLGYSPAVQSRLQDAGVTNIRELSNLLPPQRNTDPTEEPPTLDLPAEQQRKLEEILPEPIHETVLHAQALRSEIDPEYPA